jgi:hypothetical protein
MVPRETSATPVHRQSPVSYTIMNADFVLPSKKELRITEREGQLYYFRSTSPIKYQQVVDSAVWFVQIFYRASREFPVGEVGLRLVDETASVVEGLLRQSLGLGLPVEIRPKPPLVPFELLRMMHPIDSFEAGLGSHIARLRTGLREWDFILRYEASRVSAGPDLMAAVNGSALLRRVDGPLSAYAAHLQELGQANKRNRLERIRAMGKRAE